jgi:chromate transporter
MPDESDPVGVQSNSEVSQTRRLTEVFLLFLRLGLFSYGGPAVYIAMMRDEVVRRRRWLDDARFLDLLGATNLIPGPNATEMAIYLGRVRAGWRGTIPAGVCFIVPAMVITLGFAWAYVEYGSTPEVSWLLYGVKPVIIGVVVQALWSLGRTAVRGWFMAVVGAAILALYLWGGVNEIGLLFGGALFVMVARNLSRLAGLGAAGAGLLLPGLGAIKVALPLGASAAAATASVSLAQLFLTFLKIGSILYGSGYVLLAFLRTDFVERLGWLTEEQLLDAVAVGQVTPGPVLSTATFIGYVLGSWEGALLATVGVFLPSFIFVAVTSPIVPHLRRWHWTGALLDGVNIAALALMAGVTWQLGRTAIVDPLTGALAVLGALLLVRFGLNSAWLVLLGGAVGFIYKGLTG